MKAGKTFSVTTIIVHMILINITSFYMLTSYVVQQLLYGLCIS